MLPKLIQLTILALFIGCEKPQPPTPLPPPQPPVSVSGVARGFTLDSVEDLPKIVSAIKAMSYRPWVRVVCDVPNPPSDYKKAIDELSKISEVIIQVSDSEYARQLTPDQFEARTRAYIEAFPQIKIIEVANEINMCNGCNPASDSLRFAAQTDKAMAIAKHYGKKTMVTPYWNMPDCADNNGEYKAWLKKYLSQSVKQGANYVALSVYGMDCEGRPEPSYAELDKELDALQSIFPNAQVMIGEYGADRAREKKYNIKNSDIVRHYIGYHRAGFGGVWYGTQMINGELGGWQEFVK